MAKHLYVYYKVPTAELQSALAQARDFQAQFSRECRACAIRVRPDTSNGLATVMEIYEGIYSNFSHARWLALLPSSLSNLKRHEEWFEDAIEPCV